jgi:hypothetical protein
MLLMIPDPSKPKVVRINLLYRFFFLDKGNSLDRWKEHLNHNAFPVIFLYYTNINI